MIITHNNVKKWRSTDNIRRSDGKPGDDGRAIERDECCVINEPVNHKTLTR